jgi:hypothetical protein
MSVIFIRQTRALLLRIAAVAILFALVACGGIKGQIIGQWKVTSDTSGLVWEFAENGVVTSGDMRGKYSLGDRNRLKIQTPFATFVYEVKLAGNRMTWKNLSGSQTELTRVK